MPAQDAEGAANAVGADLGSVSGPAVVHEGHVRAGTEKGFPQLIRRADEHGEATFVHLLHIGHWTVLGIVRGVVQFPGFASGQILFHRSKHPTFELGSGQGGFPELGVVGWSGFAANYVKRDQVHNRVMAETEKTRGRAGKPAGSGTPPVR